MYQTLEQKGRSVKAKLLREGSAPQQFVWRNGRAQIVFNDGVVEQGSCIRCHDAPCIEYHAEELLVRGLDDFPADMDPSVCPSGAITWELTRSSPTVDPELCISCGLCISRCPVGAIGVGSDSKAFVNDANNQYFTEANTPVTPEIIDGIKARFSGVPSRGRFLLETDAVLESIYTRVEELMQTTPKLPQHLTRNLLLAVGNEAAMRRLGDVNVRMELVFSNSAAVGTVEVEIGEGVLDAPRNIIDNSAVLVSRYGFSKTAVASLIVTLRLPNQRSDYWHVLKDIKDVLGISIGSLTIGALMMLVWEQKRVPIEFLNQFYTDEGTHSIRAALVTVLGRELNISLRHLGVAESSK